MKVIPAIDLMEGKVVRLYKGDPQQKTVYSDDPVSVAKAWVQDGADMLHLVDLDAALGRGSNAAMLQEIAAAASPVQVEIAGGLRSMRAAADAAEHASRVVVGTMAFQDRRELERVSGMVGKSRVVISVDHIGGEVLVQGWQAKTGVGLLDAMRDFVSGGFSEFLLTDVSRDGTMQGPEVEYLKQACGIESANVIASGGISSLADVQRVSKSSPFGVILGKALYEGKVGIREARLHGSD